MSINSKSMKKLLWIIAIGVICIGVGFAAGAATATLKAGKASQINAIKDNLFTMKSIKDSPQKFEKVLLASTRTRIATTVCYQYTHASDDSKSKIRVYVDEYNALVGDSNSRLSLPSISSTSNNSKVQSIYCAIRG